MRLRLEVNIGYPKGKKGREPDPAKLNEREREQNWTELMLKS